MKRTLVILALLIAGTCFAKEPDTRAAKALKKEAIIAARDKLNILKQARKYERYKLKEGYLFNGYITDASKRTFEENVLITAKQIEAARKEKR